MGSCASVPKAMRGEETAVPPPEQPKEENPVPTEVAEAKAEEEKVALENDKSQSIGTLLVEEVPKELEGSSQATTVPEIEESRPDLPPVSEPVVPVAAEAEEKSTKATALKKINSTESFHV